MFFIIIDSYLRNKYVLVKRGRCYFSTKAIHAQYAGAAGLIVVDSEENKGKLPKRMPGAENDRHLIKIPSIMISYLDGQKIIKASTSALILSLEAIFALFIGILIAGEILGLISWIGVLLVLLSIFLVIKE